MLLDSEIIVVITGTISSVVITPALVVYVPIPHLGVMMFILLLIFPFR